MNEGEALLGSGEPEQAARAFEAASGLMPDNPEPLLLLAEARRREGNAGASILALKRAMLLNPGQAPEIKRKLAERHEEDGRARDAIAVLLELREADELRDLDVLRLARLQTREGQHKEAFQTLERIQRDRPDDVDAKVVEAEILLLKGDELLAAKLMDKLLEQTPTHTEARLLRARYFLNSGYPQEAEKDLARVTAQDAGRLDVVTLRARVLTLLGRHAEAEAALTRLVEAYPRDPDALAQLAETKLNMDQHAEAQQLVDKALGFRPRFARALYVRARALEAQGNPKGAEESYRYALTSDPGFAPALSRMWRLHEQASRRTEAMNTLEKLLFMGEASLEEKAALAGMYASSRTQVERGRKLIEEALRHEPGNEAYLATREALLKAAPPKQRGGGPVILRGGR
jgi:tetratricopeptide (TPR) repeat protein